MRAYREGLRAERAGDLVTAYSAYSDATAYAPRSPVYLLRYSSARFRLVQQHCDRAEREALAGRLGRAKDELRAALRLDPGYSVARERLSQFESMDRRGSRETGPQLAGPAVIRPQPGTRNFDYRGQTRGAYEEIARQFGLVAAFDGDLRDRAVRLRVQNVDFRTAMKVLAQQTGTFWQPVNAQTFFVAEDNPQKRREYELEVVRTIVLPASVTPTEMTETLRLVRSIVGTRQTDLDRASRTLTIRDTPQGVALAQALVDQIEQPRGELMLEIEILEVNRNAALRLGITQPSTARLLSLSTQDIRDFQQAQTTAELVSLIQRVFGTSAALAGQGGLGGLLPPFIAFGGGKTIFLSTLPGAAADFAKSLSLVRSGRRILLRGEDGQPASFFVGERFPIALALLSSSLVGSQIIQGALPRRDFAVGKGPVALAPGNFDGAGPLDLAVVNRDDNSVLILLGNGDGSFTPGNTIPVGVGPVAVAAADFNEDGNSDLAVSNQADDTISILLGNGDGSFTAGQILATGQQSGAILTADFNADGKPDLAVTDQADNTVAIFLGQGDGTFAAGSMPATGANPSGLVTGDFNADGNLDLAVTNRDDNTVSILLGNGDGTFAAKNDFATGEGPAGLAANDFNADGRPDLAVANQTANTLSVLLGNSDGTFGSRTDISTGTGPTAVTTADFNGDGRIDLVAANQSSNTASVLLGAGDGTFLGRLDVPTGSSPAAVAARDFNGDLTSDLAVANQGSDSVSVILNTPSLAAAATSALQSQYPGAEYEDLGLKVSATPRLHPDDEVTLQLKFEIRSLAGTTVNGIPVISNRTIEQSVRLRENETTILSGILQRQEMNALTGLPGLQATGRRNNQESGTELLIVITPRQVRLAPRKDVTIYAGRAGASSPSGGNP